MKLNDLRNLAENNSATEKMPVLFLGHGSPMNAIEENEFVTGLRETGKSIIKPKAILCVSAHWETKGTHVTAMEKPRTIHDFGGFPKELFDVQYPAPGSPELAGQVKSVLNKTTVGLDEKWGLDHGCWSVVKHLFPNADIPIVQLSLDYDLTPQSHYDLAKELRSLRNKGILIVGSGNLVHNLSMIAWNKIDEIGYGFDWAIEAQNIFNKCISKGDHKSLINYSSLGKAVKMAIPTPEHFLPILYAVAAKEESEEIMLFNDKPVAGSLTMTSLKIG